jgi:hypothetical protein
MRAFSDRCNIDPTRQARPLIGANLTQAKRTSQRSKVEAGKVRKKREIVIPARLSMGKLWLQGIAMVGAQCLAGVARSHAIEREQFFFD